MFLLFFLFVGKQKDAERLFMDCVILCRLLQQEKQIKAFWVGLILLWNALAPPDQHSSWDPSLWCPSCTQHPGHANSLREWGCGKTLQITVVRDELMLNQSANNFLFGICNCFASWWKAKKDYYTISVKFAVEYSSVSLPDTVPKSLKWAIIFLLF